MSLRWGKRLPAVQEVSWDLTAGPRHPADLRIRVKYTEESLSNV
jgi:hypothetical protein